ncbi:MAG: outer membrane lipoprotein-sorting protein [candidate division WOR-3 bacterium]|nr:MAG: outer membrane lipoprotein-sorting protein [candidate division WOR-3 bacterium]
MKSITILMIMIMSMGIFTGSAHAQEMTAQDIINTMTETMNPEQTEGKMEMTIMTSSGEERTFLYHTYSKGGGEMSLMKYLEPSRVKGQTILMLNDANDIWTYFPRTKRIRKLASHAKKQKLEGSDFSYEDMGGSDEFINEYDAVRLDDEKKEGRTCYKLELTRKPEGSAGYSRLVIWVDQEYMVPLVIDYYHDEDNSLREKQLICRDIQLIDNIYTPMQYTMYNKLDNTKTTMKIVEVHYDVDLPDDLFTEQGMQR